MCLGLVALYINPDKTWLSSCSQVEDSSVLFQIWVSKDRKPKRSMCLILQYSRALAEWDVMRTTLHFWGKRDHFLSSFSVSECRLHFHGAPQPLHCVCRGFAVTSLSDSGCKSKWRMAESQYPQWDGQWKAPAQSVSEIPAGDGQKAVCAGSLAAGGQSDRHHAGEVCGRMELQHRHLPLHHCLGGEQLYI